MTNYSYSYPRPAVTTDVVLFQKDAEDYELLLIKRKYPPFANQWALPGGFIEENETLEQCAQRELKEETGLQGLDLLQFRAYSTPDRDPRGWTISVVFHAFLDTQTTVKIEAKDDASDAAWFPIHELPELAFDHALIVRESINALP
jgi:8-oxo-dGTP diphosphatase